MLLSNRSRLSRSRRRGSLCSVSSVPRPPEPLADANVRGSSCSVCGHPADFLKRCRLIGFVSMLARFVWEMLTHPQMGSLFTALQRRENSASFRAQTHKRPNLSTGQKPGHPWGPGQASFFIQHPSCTAVNHRTSQTRYKTKTQIQTTQHSNSKD